MLQSYHNIANSFSRRLVDRYGRFLNYLRLSVTDRCNLRCLYCMPSQGINQLPHQEILSLEELARLSRIAISLGVDKIRITGGEPLIRRNLVSLLTKLDALVPRPDLRLTTNGLFLIDNLEMLIAHGISTVNISLDTLKPERYGTITGQNFEKGRQSFARVWAGINAALKSNAITVKINTVLLSGINEDEIADFARLTLTNPLSVRFIEYMPIGRRALFQPQYFFSAKKILTKLCHLGSLMPLPTRPGDGPAQRYRLKKAAGELGIITALSSHFCKACNRLRLSAEGLLVPCLFSNQTLDVKGILRSSASDIELANILLAAATAKPKHHTQTILTNYSASYQMSYLGG